MKRKWFVLLILAHISMFSFGQKKIIDYSAIKNWPVIDNSSIKISNDGGYIIDILQSAGRKTLQLYSTKDSWKREIIIAQDAEIHADFSENSGWLIFNKTEDSVGLVNLTSRMVEYIGKTRSFKIPVSNHGQWLAYQLNDTTRTLVLLNLSNNKKQLFTGVDDYLFDDGGYTLVIQKAATTWKLGSNSIIVVDLATGESHHIAHSCKGYNFVFDNTNSSLAFIAETTGGTEKKQSIRYYKPNLDSAEIVVDSTTPGMNGMKVCNADLSLNDASGKLFFHVEKQKKPRKNTISDSLVGPEIWDYKDELDHFKIENNGPFYALYNLKSKGAVVQLQQYGDVWTYKSSANERYMVFASDFYGPNESGQRITARPNIYLVSIENGSRTLVKKRLLGSLQGLSASGKFVIWYDSAQKAWFTYNIQKKAVKNISNTIPVATYSDTGIPKSHHPFDIGGWTADDKSVVIYDQYDIWLVDPNGIVPPFNITHGTGLKQHIQFRIMHFDPEKLELEKDTLLLTAINLDNKQNGFYQLSMAGAYRLKKLVMKSQIFYFEGAHAIISDGIFTPLKARDVSTYVLTPMAPAKYPNLGITHDFTYFKQITSLAPQQAYNWYSNQLVTWQLPDGTADKGILYKPKDFDPARKYPLIFFYYEENSDLLNYFINPALSYGAMNIPWFTSHDYLVFIPDIHYKVGYPGKSACDAVESAAKYLEKFPWVDRKHMGIQGHSFGGFETNYIVSHSKLFAAAAEAEGVSNAISDYNKYLYSNGHQFYYEYDQGRIGATLWQRPDLYIANSPIFQADKVITPLLILHNKQDFQVLFDQGAGWYDDLKYLGKKVWMVSYANEGHTVGDEKDKLDYTIRLQQFFDYYLKGASPPVWMTHANPHEDKKTHFGLELDTSGAKP